MTMEPIALLAELQPERPVAALIDGVQVVVVRTIDDRVYAAGQRDPYTGMNVMARGIVGSVHRDGVDVPTLHSPLHKQAFDLRTGQSLADDGVTLGSWDAAVVDGVVYVGSGVAWGEAELAEAS